MGFSDTPLQPGKYLVVGLGVTGEALIRFLDGQGLDWIAFDEYPAEKFKGVTEKFSGSKGRFYFEALPEKALQGVQAVFVSPGVPPTGPWARQAQAHRIPIIGELELASRYLKGSMLAVTGTNGKSTTVSLLHAILLEAGKSSGLLGNIGRPLITAAAEPPKDYYVVEVSSYQLETIQTFHPKVSVVMNVTPDHLERHKDMDGYALAKARIFENQDAGDFFVYNADDPYCLRMAKKARAKAVPFSLVNHHEFGGFVDRQEMVIRVGGSEARYALSDCSLMGIHNQENMLAAVLSASLVGIRPESIRKALKEFKALPHRLEKVGVFKGAAFFDDSKGTNVGSVVMSLASFEKDVILILGGRDKGGDYGPLIPLIRHKVKAVVVLGEAREKIAKALSGVKPIHVVETMQQAVAKSFELVCGGETVLLSPACSSFDQYRNYAERGDDFARWARHYGV